MPIDSPFLFFRSHHLALSIRTSQEVEMGSSSTSETQRQARPPYAPQLAWKMSDLTDRPLTDTVPACPADLPLGNVLPPPQITYLFQRRIPTVWNGIPLCSFVWSHSYLSILSIYWARSYLIDPSSACQSHHVDSTSSWITCNQSVLLPNALGTHTRLNRTYFHANA